MDLLVIIIIAATALVSFKGFNDRGFFSVYVPGRSYSAK
jgi:hypothetical protein